MIFGNETPFHLRPLPNRGLRKREAEALQHYPDYHHPLEPSTHNAAYLSEAHRLHPTLTVTDELKHDRAVRRERDAYNLQLRQQRVQARLSALRQTRDAEYAAAEARAAQLAGTAQKNVGSENRDVITHQCHTVEAQREKDYRDALAKHSYHARQRVMHERLNVTGYNIISWEPLKEIAVPPRPAPLQQQQQPQEVAQSDVH